MHGPGVRAPGRRNHGRDPPGWPGRFRRGQGHAQGDVSRQHLHAVLQHKPAGGRDRGAADLQRPGARPGGAARAGRRRGGRRGQLRLRSPGAGRGRVRGGRPHAPPWRRHAAARAPGLVRPQSPDNYFHRGDANGEQGHAERIRRRRPAGRPPLRGRGFQADVSPAQRGRRPHARELPERRGRKGEPRRDRQPAARARAQVGRGDRRQPAPGDRGPYDPGQHPGRRVRRPALHREPARQADRRRAVPVLRARIARGRRPGGDRGARRTECSTWPSGAASAACGRWW